MFLKINVVLNLVTVEKRKVNNCTLGIYHVEMISGCAPGNYFLYTYTKYMDKEPRKIRKILSAAGEKK